MCINIPHHFGSSVPKQHLLTTLVAPSFAVGGQGVEPTGGKWLHFRLAWATVLSTMGYSSKTPDPSWDLIPVSAAAL